MMPLSSEQGLPSNHLYPSTASLASAVDRSLLDPYLRQPSLEYLYMKSTLGRASALPDLTSGHLQGDLHLLQPLNLARQAPVASRQAGLQLWPTDRSITHS